MYRVIDVEKKYMVTKEEGGEGYIGRLGLIYKHY